MSFNILIPVQMLIDFVIIFNTFIQKLINWDVQLLLAINAKHNVFFDFIMYWASDRFLWIPLYVFLIFYILYKYRIKAVLIISLALLAVTFSDLISYHLFKEYFLRLRPCHNPMLNGLLHLVNGECGGQYGFVSGHATNSFAIATYLIFFLRNKVKYFVPISLFWASLLAYSRIYLGVHYPADVVCGAILGIIIGFIFIRIFKLLEKRFDYSQKAEK